MRIHGCGTSQAVLVSASFLLLVARAFAADPASPIPASPDIVVVVDPQQESAASFGQVIADAAQYRLQDLGLDVRVDMVSPGDAASPVPKAAQAGGAAVLVCSYRVEGQQMAVNLGWYDPQGSAVAVSAERKGDMDLHLDGVIFAALDDILAKVQGRIKAMAARRAAAQNAASTAGTPAPLEPAHPQDGAAPGAPPAASPPAAAPAAPGAVRLLIAGGFAPFVPTGAAASYFTLGYLPSALVSLLVPTPAGPIGIGLYTGVDYFAAVGLIDTSETFLIPVGLDVRFELDLGALRPFFHLAGGPAVLVMVTGSQGTLVDVLPFLKSGIGLEYRITAWLGIAVVADYDLYFEMPYLIMGFSPSVNVAVRL